MNYESVGPSAVKSIRQREFLNNWLRLYMRRRELPALADFAPERMDEERPDLMSCDIERNDHAIRYRVTYAGARLIEAYGISPVGHSLQDQLAPALWSHVGPIYRACVDRGMPVCSTFAICDVEGHQVDCERLLLPFGEGRDVRSMIASIKTISVEGRFINKNLMRPEDHAPAYALRAVIDRDFIVGRPPASPAGDVIEV